MLKCCVRMQHYFSTKPLIDLNYIWYLVSLYYKSFSLITIFFFFIEINLNNSDDIYVI